MTMIITV